MDDVFAHIRRILQTSALLKFKRKNKLNKTGTYSPGKRMDILSRKRKV